MRRPNANTMTMLVFIVILLVAALAVALLFLLRLGNGVTQRPAADEPDAAPPAYAVDEEAIVRYAADFDVSIEYLQLVLPETLVYRDGAEYIFQPIDSSIARHDYDWTRLAYAAGRTYYFDEAYPDVRYGIDVSEYQGEIDWQAVAADGVSFAFIRAGYRGYGSGALLADARYAENLSGASAAGLDIGVYFFSQAITKEEAKEEAELLLTLIEGYDVSYPVVFDMEEIYLETARTDSLSREEATEIARAFCRTIQKAGLQPMIYGNTKWLAGRLDLAELADDYPLWFAQYYDKPLFPYDFSFWQYSSSGSVAGIEGDVDLNIQFKPFAE